MFVQQSEKLFEVEVQYHSAKRDIRVGYFLVYVGVLLEIAVANR